MPAPFWRSGREWTADDELSMGAPGAYAATCSIASHPVPSPFSPSEWLREAWDSGGTPGRGGLSRDARWLGAAPRASCMIRWSWCRGRLRAPSSQLSGRGRAAGPWDAAFWRLSYPSLCCRGRGGAERQTACAIAVGARSRRAQRVAGDTGFLPRSRSTPVVRGRRGFGTSRKYRKVVFARRPGG